MTVLDEPRVDWHDLRDSLPRIRARRLLPASFPIADTYEGQIIAPQSLHKYTYAHDEPVNNSDPSGQFIGAALGGLVGFLIGFGISSYMRGSDAAVKTTVYRSVLGQLARLSLKHYTCTRDSRRGFN